MGDRSDQSNERSARLSHSLFRGCKGAGSDLFYESPQGSIRPEEVFNGVFVHSQNLKTRVTILKRQEQVLKRAHVLVRISNFCRGVFALGKVKLQRSVIFIANDIQYAASPSGAAWTEGLHMPPRWGLEASKKASGAINMALRWSSCLAC